MSVSEIQELAERLKELKEKNPYKFYELKGIVEGLYLAQKGKRIEEIFSI